jgi:hypothetical protein
VKSLLAARQLSLSARKARVQAKGLRRGSETKVFLRRCWKEVSKHGDKLRFHWFQYPSSLRLMVKVELYG